ncbi:uncharacterized protein LOC142583575 [Dermacentor variabilis]|uniref:uncharacterized protein LOC142583575 n=1 Tax=Dermacentor variabilis TaxID=34621 RepID=UPI003F5C40B1
MHPLNMRRRHVNGAIGLIACLQFLYSTYTSLGAPVPTVVVPRILEERSNSGELVVAIHAGWTLVLRKVSVLREHLEVTTLEEHEKRVHYMNGSRLEQHLYHDPQARAAVILTRTGGLRLVGILSPTERIRPSAAARYGTRVKHDIFPIAQTDSDAENSSDVFREDVDGHPDSALSEPFIQTARKVPEALKPENGSQMQ